jgi:hypothetical protein
MRFQNDAGVQLRAGRAQTGRTIQDDITVIKGLTMSGREWISIFSEKGDRQSHAKGPCFAPFRGAQPIRLGGSLAKHKLSLRQMNSSATSVEGQSTSVKGK